MKKVKQTLAIALAAAMVIAMASPSDADAAKKPKLNKTKASIFVGKTLKLSVKNSSKKAKVTWKSSKAKVAKITKKVTKGKSASATIKALKVGKTNITAAYKLGKKTTKLKCIVTVKAAETVTPSAVPTATTKVTPTATAKPVQPVATATVKPVQPIVTATVKPTTTATNTPKPKVTSKPTAVPTASPSPVPSPDATIYKTYVDVNVDGVAEGTWDFADEMSISNWKADGTGTAQTSNAKAKMLWTDKFLYILVTADDPSVDLTSEKTYQQDSVELFFDENNIKTDYETAKAFQYRQAIKEGAAGEKAADDHFYWKGGDITSAVKTTATGYVCEFAIPLETAPVAKNFAGVEVQINDASDGTRNGTWNLFAKPDGATAYESSTVFGNCQYMIKAKVSTKDIDFTNPENYEMVIPDQFKDNADYNTTMNAECKVENGVVYCKSANNLIVKIPDGIKVTKGDVLSITMKGSYSGENGFRMWLVDTRTGASDSAATTSEQITCTPEQGDIEVTYKLESTEDSNGLSDGTSDAIMIKASSWNGMIEDLVIKSISLVVNEPIVNDPVEATKAPAETTEAPAEATKAPAEATKAPAEATKAPAEATEAPAVTTVDLSKAVSINPEQSANIAYDAATHTLTGTNIDGFLIPIGFDCEVGSSIKVTVSGEVTGTPRLWLSNADANRFSEIINPMAFETTYTFTNTEPEKDAQDKVGALTGPAGYLQIKAPWSQQLTSAKITKIIVESVNN